MFIFNFLKGCFGGEDNDIEYLPLARTAMPKPMPMNVTSYLPISARPIPEVDVSASSSTAIAMFEHEAIASMGSPHNSFTSNDTFEDVDLSTPVKFATPPKVLKIVTCPFNDQHEINNILVVSGPLHNGVKVSHMSSTCSSTPPTDYKQPARVAPPFDDEHEVESEPEVEYAPTTPSPGSDYAERALEYQRGKFLSISVSSSMNEHANHPRSVSPVRSRQRGVQQLAA